MPTDEQLERAAFAAFCRNMADYDIEPGNLHLAFYGDDGVRDFWIKEARAWRDDFKNAIQLEGVTHDDDH